MNLWKYIKEKRYFILFGLFLSVFPGLIMMLSTEQAWTESDGSYCMTVMLVLFFFYLLMDFHKERKKAKELSSFISDQDIDFVLSVPQGTTVREKLYKALLLQEKENADRLMKAAEEKKEEDIAFIEAWVHEIKTPIAAIRLMIENALDHPTEHTLYDISDELMRIEDMVQKTICYSGLEDISKDCQIEKINLAKVVSRCMQKEYANIHNKQIKLEMGQLDLMVYSDEKWLGFIIKQILDNAVKYSLAGGVISIRTMDDNGSKSLIIEDHGIGIREEDLRLILHRGYTGQNGRSVENATGIGLYLSQRLCSKLGHRLSITSKIKEGTTVQIYLGRGHETEKNQEPV